MTPETAAKVADKYITKDGATPKPKGDTDPFTGEPAPERTPRATTPDVAAELERLSLERKAKAATVERLRRARVGRALKSPKCRNGGWATHPDILEAVTAWAEQMKMQRWIAVQLGKPLRTFEDAMHKDKGENPLRLAYETGRAEAEQRQVDMVQELDPTNPKHTVAWIFSMKALYGWKDRPDVSENEAPKITFVLPGPMSEADYLKKLGIEAPIDTRPATDRSRMLGGVAVGDMKDVTPGADGKLPVMGAQKVLSGGELK